MGFQIHFVATNLILTNVQDEFENGMLGLVAQRHLCRSSMDCHIARRVSDNVLLQG